MYWKLAVPYKRHGWDSDIDDHSYRKQRDLEMWFAGVGIIKMGDVDCLIYWIDDRIATGNTNCAAFMCYEAGILSAVWQPCCYMLKAKYGSLFMETVTKVVSRESLEKSGLYKDQSSQSACELGYYVTFQPVQHAASRFP